MWEKWSFFPIFLRDYSHKHFLIRESPTCDFTHWNAFECLCAVSLAQFHWKECLLCASWRFPTAWPGAMKPLQTLAALQTEIPPASSPRGLCPERCSVKSGVTCRSPTASVWELRHIGCANAGLEPPAGPALLSPQSKGFPAAKGSFTQA